MREIGVVLPCKTSPIRSAFVEVALPCPSSDIVTYHTQRMLVPDMFSTYHRALVRALSAIYMAIANFLHDSSLCKLFMGHRKIFSVYP